MYALYFIIYGAMACYYPFITVYFQSKELSFTKIGLIFATTSLISVVCQPIWGYITDKFTNKRNMLLILISLSSIAVILFIFTNSFYTIFFTVIVFNIFISPIGAIADAYSYDIVNAYKSIQFGRIRLMGSLGYAVVALVLGIVIKLTSSDAAFISYFVISILGAIIVYNIKNNSSKTTQQISFKDMTKLLGDKRFIIFMIAVFFTSIGQATNGNYIAVLIQKTGGDISNLGMLWFVVAMSELPSLFFGSKILKKYGELNVFAFGILMYALRFFLNTICSSYVLVIFVQLLQGVSFTMFLMATLQYLNKIVPTNLRTSGMTIYAALGGGLGGFLGNMAGGVIVQELNVFWLYRILAIICLFASLIVFYLKYVDKAYKIKGEIKLRMN